MNTFSQQQLKDLRVALGTFDSMTNFSLIHASFSNEGNSSNSSSYHLVHGQLEWRWIYLTMIYKLECASGNVDSEDSEFKSELILLMYDMITLSIPKFHKCTSASIIFTSSFICCCVKTMWIVIYELLSELQDWSMSFWSLFSNILDDMRNSKNPHENFPSKRILLRSSSRITCRSLDQFSVWLVSGMVQLVVNNILDAASSRESFELLESLVKNYLKTEQSEENLRTLLVILSEVIFSSATPRSESLLAVWENLQRRINSPFMIAGQSPNFMTVASVSGAGYLEKIKAQQNAVGKLNPNTSSYDMFVQLLGRIVEKFTIDGQKIQVQRVLGRIYTKFPASKLQTLNEMGIHNILKLFITLAISSNFQDVGKKISETLLQIPIEKTSHQQQLMKGHMAMLMLHRENQMNITQYVTKLMTQVTFLIEKSGSSVTSVLKIIADALPVILLQSLEDEVYENGEELLLDSWIVKYLSSGSVAEQDRVYETLTKIIQKFRAAQAKSLQSSHLTAIGKKLLVLLLPHCQQMLGKSESSGLPAVAAYLCLLSSDYEHLNSAEIPKFDVIFNSLIELNYSNNENSIKFLTSIMENKGEIKAQLDMLTIMQHWIKFSILLSGSNGILKELTRCIIKTDEFRALCDSARNNPKEFLNSKEPLCTFIADVGKKYATANNQLKLHLIDKMHKYFSTFQKWALPLLEIQQQQTSRSQTAVTADESVMRIYNFISITISHCAELVYIRSKSMCFFNVAMTHFILPQSLLMGQTQPRSINVSMYRVWPLLIEGISRLDHLKDPHIAKVLNDVIIKWAPLLKISTNSKVVAKPFLSIANSKNLAVVDLVYGKLGKNFVALQNRKPSPHACMILTILEEVMHVIEADEQKVLAIWNGMMPHVVEAAMMTEDNAPSQITSYNLIERFIKNKNFESSKAMKDLVVNRLQNITQQSQLSYYSGYYFR